MGRRVCVQGIGVDALTVPALLDRVAEAIAAKTPFNVGYVNVHVLNEAARDPGLAAFLQALQLCYADGAGVVLAARLLGDPLPGRMTGADWIVDFAARAAAAGWRVVWVGGKPGVTARAAAKLQAEHPGFNVVYTDHGFHPPEAQAALVDRVNAAGADVLLVGMGTPLQERWVAAHRPALAMPVVWTVGATADFVSGEVSRGPRTLYANQEWIARLLVDPRRLWRRFLVGNPLFFARLLWGRG